MEESAAAHVGLLPPAADDSQAPLMRNKATAKKFAEHHVAVPPATGYPFDAADVKAEEEGEPVLHVPQAVETNGIPKPEPLENENQQLLASDGATITHTVPGTVQSDGMTALGPMAAALQAAGTENGLQILALDTSTASALRKEGMNTPAPPEATQASLSLSAMDTTSTAGPIPLPTVVSSAPPPMSALLGADGDFSTPVSLPVTLQVYPPTVPAGVPVQPVPAPAPTPPAVVPVKEKGRRNTRPLPETKKCNLCYHTWPVSDFYRSSSGPVPYCKHGCHNLFQRANKCGYRIRELREAISNGTLEEMLKMDKLPAGAGRARARAEFRAERGLPDGFGPVQPGSAHPAVPQNAQPTAPQAPVPPEAGIPLPPTDGASIAPTTDPNTGQPQQPVLPAGFPGGDPAQMGQFSSEMMMQCLLQPQEPKRLFKAHETGDPDYEPPKMPTRPRNARGPRKDGDEPYESGEDKEEEGDDEIAAETTTRKRKPSARDNLTPGPVKRASHENHGETVDGFMFPPKPPAHVPIDLFLNARGRPKPRNGPGYKVCALCWTERPMDEFFCSSSGPVAYCNHGCFQAFHRGAKRGITVAQIRRALLNDTVRELLDGPIMRGARGTKGRGGGRKNAQPAPEVFRDAAPQPAAPPQFAEGTQPQYVAPQPAQPFSHPFFDGVSTSTDVNASTAAELPPGYVLPQGLPGMHIPPPGGVAQPNSALMFAMNNGVPPAPNVMLPPPDGMPSPAGIQWPTTTGLPPPQGNPGLPLPDGQQYAPTSSLPPPAGMQWPAQSGVPPPPAMESLDMQEHARQAPLNMDVLASAAEAASVSSGLNPEVPPAPINQNIPPPTTPHELPPPSIPVAPEPEAPTAELPPPVE